MARYADLYAFTDFRSFLAAYFKARSAREPAFSQAYICRKLGLPNSRSYFGDVVRGHKPLTPAKTESLLALLGLEPREAEYFRALVLHNQSSFPSERAFYLERMFGLNRSPAFQLGQEAFSYYRDWRHGAVRALLDVIDIDEGLAPLAQAIFPPQSLPKIKASFALLKKLGLIRRDEAGHWKPSGKVIHSGPYMQDEIVKAYQAACLDVAKAAIQTQVSRPQNISTETMSLSGAAYRAIEARLQEFKSEVRRIIGGDEEKADRVYQLNVQLFPHSK